LKALHVTCPQPLHHVAVDFSFPHEITAIQNSASGGGKHLEELLTSVTHTEDVSRRRITDGRITPL
jgi:hypothetical protein